MRRLNQKSANRVKRVSRTKCAPKKYRTSQSSSAAWFFSRTCRARLAIAREEKNFALRMHEFSIEVLTQGIRRCCRLVLQRIDAPASRPRRKKIHAPPTVHDDARAKPGVTQQPQTCFTREHAGDMTIFHLPPRSISILERHRDRDLDGGAGLLFSGGCAISAYQEIEFKIQNTTTNVV